jgi:signal transduction histidine kinase
LWSGEEATFAFSVDPVFWRTWWFRLGVVLACACCGLILYRLRLIQLTNQLNLRFEERLSERTRIAQDLHDTLLQGFLSASMQLHVADEHLPADSPAKPLIGRVLQLTGQVIEEGRNAVQGLRSSDPGAQDLGQAFSRVQDELGISEQVNFKVVVDGQPRPLHAILRDETYRIGREALVNAFRHSRAKNIEVEIEYGHSRLRVLVRDDGNGIDPEVLVTGREGHWGLVGMRERAERIGGRLRVLSSLAAGTEVELSIPGHIAFRPDPHSRETGWMKGLQRKLFGRLATRVARKGDNP